MRTIRAVIADDEEPARDDLRYLLASLGGFEIVGEARTGPEAVSACKSLSPDVLFLDIAMPGLTGMEVARELRRWDHCPHFVFVTAYDEYAVQAFEVCAVDYLLKPFDSKRMETTLRNLHQAMGSGDPIQAKIDALIAHIVDGPARVRVPAEKNGATVLVDASEIVYAQCTQGRVRLKTYDGEYFTRLTLSDLEHRLGRRFFKSHRAFLVNLDRVSEVIPWFSGTYTLVVKDKEKSRVPVARAQVRDMKSALGI